MAEKYVSMLLLTIAWPLGDCLSWNLELHKQNEHERKKRVSTILDNQQNKLNEFGIPAKLVKYLKTIQDIWVQTLLI